MVEYEVCNMFVIGGMIYGGGDIYVNTGIIFYRN